jgi:hypothetical protein
MAGKMVLECHFGLHPSEKELLKWCSGMFHHKNTLGRRKRVAYFIAVS